MFVAKFMALSQHLPRGTKELTKILMQYTKCTSHDLIQTNVTAGAKLVEYRGGREYIYIYTFTQLHNSHKVAYLQYISRYEA